MAKGKYAARAANRLVQTDNELLQAKVLECEQLKAELTVAKDALVAAQNALSSEVLGRASELARDFIAQSKDEADSRIAAIESEAAQSGFYCATALWDYFIGVDGNGSLPKFFVSDVIPRLITGQTAVAEFINSRLDQAGVSKANRRTRRHGFENIKRETRIRETDHTLTDSVTKMAMAAALGSPGAKEVLSKSVSGAQDEQEA